MADVIHKNLTGAEIHEPKGISTAADNSVYVSNGLGSGSWVVPTPIDTSGIVTPVGCMVMYAGITAPSKWMLCYGQQISRTTYSSLFTAIGTTYGAGNGSTTFTLPDCRGRSIAGQDDAGGVSANRLTGLSGGVNGDTLGASGGLESHLITTAQTPVLTGTTSSDGLHTHALNYTSLVRNRTTTPGGVGSPIFTQEVTISVDAGGVHTHAATVNDTSGAGLTHRNLQPSLILNTIIYTGVV